jgi:hypothetical protein
VRRGWFHRRYRVRWRDLVPTFAVLACVLVGALLDDDDDDGLSCPATGDGAQFACWLQDHRGLEVG